MPLDTVLIVVAAELDNTDSVEPSNKQSFVHDIFTRNSHSQLFHKVIKHNKNTTLHIQYTWGTLFSNAILNEMELCIKYVGNTNTYRRLNYQSRLM